MTRSTQNQVTRKIIWLVILSLAYEVSAKIRIPCVTPSRDEGVCVDVKECKSIIAYMRNRTRVENADEYLRQSKCSPPRAKTPHICCPVEISRGEMNGQLTEAEDQVAHNSLLPLKPNCGELIQDYLIRGTQTDVFDYPWLVLLEYTTGCPPYDQTLAPSCLEEMRDCQLIFTNGSNIANNCGFAFYDARLGGEHMFKLSGTNSSFTAELLAILEALKYDKGKQLKCGGVLISDRYVLTAAHCASNNLVAVRLGEYDTSTAMDCVDYQGDKVCNDPPEVIPVEEVITHDQGDVDLALLRLQRKYTPSEFALPACLPVKKNKPETDLAGKYMTIAGWNKTTSDVKVENKLIILDNVECRKKLNINVEGNRLCAEKRNSHYICTPDGGGPIMEKDKLNYWTVYGIYSFGLNECSWPTVYTRVSEYLDWIQANVKP